MSINAFIANCRQMISKKDGKFVRSTSKWIQPYKKEHPTDKLMIKSMLNEKIRGNRIIGLKALIRSGDVHQLHTHDNEYVLVYCLSGKCVVTIGNKTRTVLPHTMIFIPPNIPHRFYNKFSKPWEGIAFAIGTKSKINNIWMES